MPAYVVYVVTSYLGLLM